MKKFLIRFLIKFVLIIVVIYCGLSSYKLVIGTKTAFGNEQQVTLQTVRNLATLQNIYYYGRNNNYTVIVETSNTIYRLKATQAEITALKVAGFFVAPVRPKAIRPIPWWIFGIVCVIIVLFRVPKSMRKEQRI